MAKYFTIVHGEDQSKAVQDYLFSKGKVWFDEQTYQYLHCEALFWSDEENYIAQLRYDWEAQEYEDEGEIRVEFDFVPCTLKAVPRPVATIKIDGKEYAVAHIEKLLKEKQQ